MKKINLRKASAILHTIQATINSIQLPTTVEFNEYSTAIEAKIEAGNDKLFKNMTSRINLTTASGAIRNLVYQANYESGIYKILANLNSSGQALATLKLIKTDSVAMSVTEIDKRIGRYKSAETVNKYDCSFTSSVLLPEDISHVEQEIQCLNTAIQKLKDELLELNYRTEIQIPDDLELLLLDNKII